jgi:hypothetical protein
MPGGVPKWVRCYDNGGETFDRYTIVYIKKRVDGQFLYVGASEYPFDPQGFGQHGESFWPIDRPTYGHLGKKIPFTDLPPDVQRLVVSDYKAIWEIT